MKHQVRVAYVDTEGGPLPSAIGQIQGTPTIRAFVPKRSSARNEKQMLSYDSAREVGDLVRFATANMPNYVERVASEAEANAEADKQRRELVDLRNQAEQIVYGTKKAMSDLGDKVPAATRSAVESAISNVEERVKGDDAAAIQKSLDALNQAAQELGKISYESAKAGGPAGAAGAAGDAPKKDDVIVAEYEVKDGN
jgi:molecular chaperone DnaK